MLTLAMESFKENMFHICQNLISIGVVLHSLPWKLFSGSYQCHRFSPECHLLSEHCQLSFVSQHCHRSRLGWGEKWWGNHRFHDTIIIGFDTIASFHNSIVITCIFIAFVTAGKHWCHCIPIIKFMLFSLLPFLSGLSTHGP